MVDRNLVVGVSIVVKLLALQQSLHLSPLSGESAVGKSSLVLRFVKGQFHEYQESTIGGGCSHRQNDHWCLNIHLQPNTIAYASSLPPCPFPSPPSPPLPSSLFPSLCLALLFPAAFLTQTVNLDDTTVKFEIWDTAGQERYHSLAPMYYRGAQAAIVVFDITNMVRSVTCFCLGGH